MVVITFHVLQPCSLPTNQCFTHISLFLPRAKHISRQCCINRTTTKPAHDDRFVASMCFPGGVYVLPSQHVLSTLMAARCRTLRVVRMTDSGAGRLSRLALQECIQLHEVAVSSRSLTVCLAGLTDVLDSMLTYQYLYQHTYGVLF